MEKIRIAVYGGGGFGREVAWLIEGTQWPTKQYEFVGFIDDDQHLIQLDNGNPFFTLRQAVETYPDVRVVIAVGSPNARDQLAKRVLAAGLAFETLVHPSVVRSSAVTLGHGDIICAGCVLTTNIVLGDHVVVIYNSTIGHDVTIGDFSTIGPGVRIAGCVNIGKRVFIGAGTVIINGTRSQPLVIGDDTVIGAASCVIRSLPAFSQVFGNPARPIPTQRLKGPEL